MGLEIKITVVEELAGENRVQIRVDGLGSPCETAGAVELVQFIRKMMLERGAKVQAEYCRITDSGTQKN